MLVGVGVADCDAPQSQRHRAFQHTAQPRKDCVHARGKIARGDIGRVRLGRCFRSLALTQVILEPSDFNSSSYASMFYVSSSFFVSAAVAGRLAQSPHRYRNRICRTRSKSVNGASETVNASEEITRRTRPAAHTHCTLTAALPMTDVAIEGTAADRRFRDRNTFGKDSA